MTDHLNLLVLTDEAGEKRTHNLAVWRVRPRQRPRSDVIPPDAVPLRGGARRGVRLVVLVGSVKHSAGAAADHHGALDAAVHIVGTHRRNGVTASAIGLDRLQDVTVRGK